MGKEGQTKEKAKESTMVKATNTATYIECPHSADPEKGMGASSATDQLVLQCMHNDMVLTQNPTSAQDTPFHKCCL